jgi:hypothetical protein
VKLEKDNAETRRTLRYAERKTTVAKKLGLLTMEEGKPLARQRIAEPDKRWRGNRLLRQGYDVCGE